MVNLTNEEIAAVVEAVELTWDVVGPDMLSSFEQPWQPEPLSNTGAIEGCFDCMLDEQREPIEHILKKCNFAELMDVLKKKCRLV